MPNLIPFLVLYHPPKVNQLHVQPVLAQNGDDALAMAAVALVKQDLGGATTVGVLDRNGLEAMMKLINGLDAALAAQA